MLGHTCTGTCICTMEEDEKGADKFVWSPECPVSGHSGRVHSVAFSPDGNHFVSGSSDKLAKIWDTKTGALVSRFFSRGAHFCGSASSVVR